MTAPQSGHANTPDCVPVGLDIGIPPLPSLEASDVEPFRAMARGHAGNAPSGWSGNCRTRPRVSLDTMSTHLAVGDVAPNFTLDTDTGTFTLSEHRGKHVIVYFYPAAMTPGCTTQACDFRDSLSALQAAGYGVVGVSKDDTATLAKFREQEGLTFTLAADPDKAVQNAYGAWGEKSLYGKLVTGSVRSTVVVDPEGKVELAQYNVKATGHVAKLRRDLGLD